MPSHAFSCDLMVSETPAIVNNLSVFPQSVVTLHNTKQKKKKKWKQQFLRLQCWKLNVSCDYVLANFLGRNRLKGGKREGCQGKNKIKGSEKGEGKEKILPRSHSQLIQFMQKNHHHSYVAGDSEKKTTN